MAYITNCSCYMQLSKYTHYCKLHIRLCSIYMTEYPPSLYSTMQCEMPDRFDESSAYHHSDFEILMKIASEDPSMQVYFQILVCMLSKFEAI